MTTEQKEFIALTHEALKSVTPVAFPMLCAIREGDIEEAAEMVLRYALTNGITPQEAMPHVESYLTES